MSRGDWMQTYTGRAFYPMTPAAEDIVPQDIAHALAMICRFGGHSRRFYSVAEHCILVSRAVAPEHALWGLLHDAAETYVGDMVRPLKYAMPDYRATEDAVMGAVRERFALMQECPPEVKDIDVRLLRDERDALMADPPQPWNAIEQVAPLGVTIHGWSPAEAKARFLARLAECAPRVHA